MYPYLLVICPYLLLALLIAYHGLKRIRAISYSRLSSNNNIADEKTGPVQGPLPGDSPAYYTGDPSNDVLEIESFDLVPNPPIMDFKLQLVGNIKQDLGPDPQLYMSPYINGRRAGTMPVLLCANGHLVIIRDGKELSKDQVPRKGRVTMVYANRFPLPWMLKGWYTLRIEMYAGKAAGKARMTGFEESIWIEGGKRDGCGGWDYPTRDEPQRSRRSTSWEVQVKSGRNT